MGFFFDGSGQRTHRHFDEELDHDDVAPQRPAPGKSSRTHGGGNTPGIIGKISLTARLAQRIDRRAREGRTDTPDQRARGRGPGHGVSGSAFARRAAWFSGTAGWDITLGRSRSYRTSVG